MWGWPPKTRPNIIIGVFLPVSFLAGIVGSVLASVFQTKWLSKQKSPRIQHKEVPNIEPTIAAGEENLPNADV
jgi:hypothetical protein